MIQLVEIVEASVPTNNPKDRYSVREIYVSPEHIIMVREDRSTNASLLENSSNPHISAGMKFSRITINKGSAGQDVVVLGSVDMIYEKIESSKIKSKQLLRG
jgi:hypothetical protein